MSWLDRRLVPAAWVAVLMGVGAMASADDTSSATAKSTRAMTDAQLAAVGKTEGLLEKKWATRSGETRARIRALYKISRASDARMWLDPTARRARVRWLGGAARIVARDLSELELLREEMAVARRARDRLDHAARSVGQVARGVPNVGSLLAPVAGGIVDRFGRYRHRSSRATLVRRGVTFSSHAGERVRASSAGVVIYAGPLRGLGNAVLIDHGGYLTVVGRLAEIVVKPSQHLRRGDSLGVAANQRVYMEVRIEGVPGGEPIDPAPLLER